MAEGTAFPSAHAYVLVLHHEHPAVVLLVASIGYVRSQYSNVRLSWVYTLLPEILTALQMLALLALGAKIAVKENFIPSKFTG